MRIATILAGLFFVSMHDVWGSSIWLVIGLHRGNNFTNSFVITFKPMATSWLYLHGSMQVFSTWQGIGVLAAFLLNTINVPVLIRMIWRKRCLDV